jgi:predicted enzyme related to lactoylglutathione lyase
MPNPVVHFEVIGKDPAALRSFYKQAFDWTIDPPMGPEAGNYAIVKPLGAATAESSINGGIGGGMDGYAGHTTFYVGVPDIKALSKVESLGGTTLRGPDEVPGGPIIALFADPEGHSIGLVQTS